MLKKLVMCVLLALSAAAINVSAQLPGPCNPGGSGCVAVYR